MRRSGVGFRGEERQLKKKKKEVKKGGEGTRAWSLRPEEEEDVETFLRVAEGRDGRQRRTWLLCGSSRQPEIQVSGVRTHTLECRVK